MHITIIFSMQYGQNRTGWPSIIDSHHIGICDVTIQQMAMERVLVKNVHLKRCYCTKQYSQLHSIEQMVNMCRVHRAQLIQGALRVLYFVPPKNFSINKNCTH